MKKKKREKWLYAYYLWLFASVAFLSIFYSTDDVFFLEFFSAHGFRRVYFITAQTDLKSNSFGAQVQFGWFLRIFRASERERESESQRMSKTCYHNFSSSFFRLHVNTIRAKVQSGCFFASFVSIYIFWILVADMLFSSRLVFFFRCRCCCCCFAHGIYGDC